MQRGRSPAGQFEAHGAGPCEVGNARRLDGKGRHAAILLFNPNIQGAGNGVIEVANAKRPRRHQCFIEHAALLADHHLGIGPGNTNHFRRIATQVGRQLVVIGVECNTGKAEAVEQVRIQVVLTQSHACAN